MLSCAINRHNSTLDPASQLHIVNCAPQFQSALHAPIPSIYPPPSARRTDREVYSLFHLEQSLLGGGRSGNRVRPAAPARALHLQAEASEAAAAISGSGPFRWRLCPLQSVCCTTQPPEYVVVRSFVKISFIAAVHVPLRSILLVWKISKGGKVKRQQQLS